MDTLTWLYLINATLLIIHEMDSAYQKEWELFHLPGGAGLFLVLHVPLIGAVLYGFLEAAQKTQVGLWFSFVLSIVGLGAFGIHFFFLKRGAPQFRQAVSVATLIAILLASQAQLLVTIFAMR